ncbi:MAG TPA: DUF3604 domain-containing protein [Planctomycetes bacterium]|nr:DUF3604 domain-containing protein [Fuerstiella sp.]HIK91232.1 DUF3604 domain-containing protein [Planctomycetota bacterium]
MKKTRRAVYLFGWMLSLLLSFAADATAQDNSAADPAKRQVFFGEQHMHTRNSFDAFTAGVTQTWEDAYRFAMGEEIELSTTKQKMKRRTPYDFVAITDHSEYYGVLKDLIDPSKPLSKSEFAKNPAEDGHRSGSSRPCGPETDPDAGPKQSDEGIRHTGTPHRKLEKIHRHGRQVLQAR